MGAERMRVGVVGAGTMGSGIAQLLVQTGYPVILIDKSQDILDRGRAAIARRLQRAEERGQIGAGSKDEALGRLTTTPDVESLSGVAWSIEAVIEDLDEKKRVFRELDRVLGAPAVLATNTSSMSITEIGAATERPEQVVGMHFFNPAPVMRLVEVVRGYATADETVGQAMNLARELGRTPIEVRKDSPGFVVNRILMPMLAEACRVLEEGIASAEDIDTAVQLGLNHPMGPFTLIDFTGVDVNRYVMDYFFSEFRDPRYATPRLLRELVRAGRLGKKVGHGVFDYEPGGPHGGK